MICRHCKKHIYQEWEEEQTFSSVSIRTLTYWVHADTAETPCQRRRTIAEPEGIYHSDPLLDTVIHEYKTG